MKIGNKIKNLKSIQLFLGFASESWYTVACFDTALAMPSAPPLVLEGLKRLLVRGLKEVTDVWDVWGWMEARNAAVVSDIAGHT